MVSLRLAIGLYKQQEVVILKAVMQHLPLNLTEHILEEQRHSKSASGNFTLLLLQISYAGKIIASHIRKSGLLGITEKTGEINSSDDEVIALDRFSNDLLVRTLSSSGQAYAIASEEMEEIHKVTEHKGDYIIFLDPLDGSKNTAYNLTVGTIFSIYHKEEGLLQMGKKQVATGYILYGPSTLFVYTTGNGVTGFTLDPESGSFLLSHTDLQIPKTGTTYAINEANSPHWNPSVNTYLAALKTKGYKARYSGTLVADAHRTLLEGGIFLYPPDTKHEQGKLRLMLEVNALAFLFEQAGGMALATETSPLSIMPESIHQRSPLVLGSPQDVLQYKKLCSTSMK